MVTDDENKTRPELNEIATTRDGKDITRGYVDALPYISPSDRVLQQAGGYIAYEELLRDDQVLATFSQRRNAVISRPWCVTPGGKRAVDKAAAVLLEETLANIDWDTVTDHMLYARHYGYAVAEIIWAIENGKVKVASIKVRDRRRFVFSPAGELLLQTSNNPNGERLPGRKFWVTSVGASHADEPYGVGLGQAIHWPVWFKRNGARFWSVYLEKFGAPTAVGKFTPGSSKEEQNKLLQAVGSVATDSGLIIPDGMQIALLEATRGGNATYENWMHYWDSAIAKIVLGQTMTTEDGSSYAQASVHYDVRQDLVTADGDLVCQSANQSWVQWLIDYNLPGAAYPKVWRDMEDAEDTEKRSQRDKTMFDMGFKLKSDSVSKIYGDDYEPIAPVEQPEAATVQPNTPAEPPAKQIGFRLPQFAEPDDTELSPVIPMSEQLEREAAPAWSGIMAHVQSLVDKAPDLPSLRDALLNAYHDLPYDKLGNVMGLAFAAAELAGRYDVTQDSGDE